MKEKQELWDEIVSLEKEILECDESAIDLDENGRFVFNPSITLTPYWEEIEEMVLNLTSEINITFAIKRGKERELLISKKTELEKELKELL